LLVAAVPSRELGQQGGKPNVEDSILILSDSASVEEHESLVFAADREETAERLSAGGFRAVCLDRRELEDTLSDARWLRRRRNRLPVLAWVDTPQVARASDLFAVGVEEIIVRDAGAPESMLARLDVIDRRPGRPVPPLAAEGITASSPAMRACLERVAKAQRSEATVLLQGETGTGKEVLARMIHAGGRRATGPFVAINCAAFPETLLESELFGYERGAFTGADRSKRGHFEQANGGTLFLDEVGETSLGCQVKLLRVLQEGRARRLGSTREHKVDARIVAASNRDLLQAVEAESFRRDLFFRLNVLPISLPPLRGRVEDIVPLVQGFLARRERPNAPKTIAPDAARLLETYAWPGNVRELENETARIVANANGEPEVTARMLSPQIQGMAPVLSPDIGSETLRETMARFEAWVLRCALEKHGGRRIATARSLGVTRECLYKKLRRYGMQ
jgi:transcriptional regulator with PAS, ATPase and Fis domain